MLKKTPQINWLGVILISFLFSLNSCEKDEGMGGTGSISGTLLLKTYNSSFDVLQDATPAADEDVYIIFGDDEIIGEKTTTNYNGKFEFPYLRAGEYTLYYMSEDSLNPQQDKKELLKKITISKGEQLNVGELIQLKSIDYDDGGASIKGRVQQLNFVKSVGSNMISIVDTVNAQDYDLYISYGDNEFYSDKISTQDDGSFEFAGLIKGNYRIFYYNDDTTGVQDKVVLETIAVVSGDNQEIALDDLMVFNRVDYNDGSAKLIGRIKQINYWKQSIYPNLIVRDTTVAQELEVYLSYGTGNFYEERIRTQGDGTFVFDNLVKGDYSIFFYSEDVSGGEAKVVVKASAKVTSDNQLIDLGDLFIEEH